MSNFILEHVKSSAHFLDNKPSYFVSCFSLIITGVEIYIMLTITKALFKVLYIFLHT